MRIAGIGCRSGAPAEAIAGIIAAALERCGLQRRDLDAVATDAAKAGEDGVARAAADLALPLIFVSADEMRRVSGRAATMSTRVLALKGVPSIAETAALAAAGDGSRLLAPRVASAVATCAIAAGDDP